MYFYVFRLRFRRQCADLFLINLYFWEHQRLLLSFELTVHSLSNRLLIFFLRGSEWLYNWRLTADGVQLTHCAKDTHGHKVFIHIQNRLVCLSIYTKFVSQSSSFLLKSQFPSLLSLLRKLEESSVAGLKWNTRDSIYVRVCQLRIRNSTAGFPLVSRSLI